MTEPARPGVAPRCPYCLDDLLPDQETVRCARCRTPHHAACFAEHQACVAYGCAGREDIPAGVSLFRVPQVTLHHRVTAERALGPFILGWKRLAPLPERRPPARCPQAYCRLSLEDREVRDGGLLRGRGVVYTPEPLRFARLDVTLVQGLARPQAVDRATLLEARSAACPEAELAPGSHPFHLEVQAPARTGPVDPFQLELVVVRGLLSSDLRSLPQVLFLLAERDDPAPAGPAPALERLPIRVAPREGEAAPAPAARPGGWVECPVSGGGEGRASVLARFVPAPPGVEGLAVTGPARLTAGEVPLQVAGGGRLASLSVALRYELVRPGGAEVVAPGLPALEEARVLGPGALDPARYGAEAVQLEARLGAARLAALARARAGGAHNAALRVRIGVDAIDASGRVVHGPTRTVTYTGA